VAVYLALPQPAPAAAKVKLRGYITSRVDDRTVAILDDKLELTIASRIAGQDAAGEHAMAMADLGPGMLIEAEGQWLDRHRFFAEKVTVNLRDGEKTGARHCVSSGGAPAKPVKFPVETRPHLRRMATGWTSAHRHTGSGTP